MCLVKTLIFKKITHKEKIFKEFLEGLLKTKQNLLAIHILCFNETPPENFSPLRRIRFSEVDDLLRLQLETLFYY